MSIVLFQRFYGFYLMISYSGKLGRSGLVCIVNLIGFKHLKKEFYRNGSRWAFNVKPGRHH